MNQETAGEKFQQLVAIMARLRAPGGCPWDRQQTFDSIKPFTLEETYEVLDAIDHRDWGELTQELGDFILQAVFYAQMASEQQLFRIEDALDAINQKLVRRHPHVFGDESARSADEVLSIWGRVKDAEPKAERKRTTGLLGGVPRALPALVEAQQIASRAAGVGFDWENAEQVLDKLHEELAEFARRAATPRRTNWKTNSATCCSSWSTWRASSKWIPSRPCAAPTRNSVPAGAISKPA